MLKFSSIPTLSKLLELQPNTQAICWDMDGTLLATEVLHEEAIALFIQDNQKRNSLKTTHFHFAELKGQTDNFVYNFLIQNSIIQNCSKKEFLDVKDTFFFKIVDEISNEELISPAMLSLLEEIQESELDMALVTSSEKIITEILLKKLNLDHFFEIILTREMTLQNKPLPEPYLRAMELLKVEANSCLIIEDSKVGLEAAKAAKVQTIIHANWY